jgi:hypothetical protein
LGGCRRGDDWRRRARAHHRSRRGSQAREVLVLESLRSGPAVAGGRQPDAQAEVRRNRGSQLDDDHEGADRDRTAQRVDRSRQPPATTGTARSHWYRSASGPRTPGRRCCQIDTNFRLSSLPARYNPSSPKDLRHIGCDAAGGQGNPRSSHTDCGLAWPSSRWVNLCATSESVPGLCSRAHRGTTNSVG